MMAGEADFSFRALSKADLPLLREWLARPHVAELGGPLPSLEELEQDMLPQDVRPRRHACFFAILRKTPVGFIQWYAPAAWHEDGWWLDEHDPGVRGIDQFLANAEQLSHGLGTAMVRAFVATLFADSAVTRIQTDPAPTNGRAIRCYEKAGFHSVREIETRDGPALLMYLDRPSTSGC